MAHFALLWKAKAVEKYRSNYEEEKLKSIALAEVGIPRKRLSEKLRSYRLATNETVSRTFSRWFPNGSTVYRCLLYLRSDQSLTAFLLKSIVGFTGGIILTYLCFIFFVFQLSISFIIATIISSVIGVLLTLGLAFSYRIRCLVFLLIPQLFSRVGRYTLTCYALVLILTGPATNTLKNSEVLSESMACSQEQIKTSVRQINESHKIRYSSIKDNLKAMIEKFEEISKQLTNVTLKINKLVLSIVSSVQATFNWFKSIATNCNHKIGTPYDYCKRMLNEGAKDCKDVLGPDYSWMCNVNYVAEATCGDLMKYQSFCGVSQFIDDSILGTVKKKLKSFSDRIVSLLYMELHIHNSYSFSSNATSSASQVAAGIVTEIRKRADPLLTWLSWSSCVTSLFLLLIIFRAKYYQQMYDTRSRFDNRYITQELRDLDLKRLREGRETILPLSRRERAKYVTTTSFRLVPSEKVNLNRSAVFMTIATFKLLIHIVADYSLYWILITIQYYGKLQTPVEDELPKISTNVSGTGLKARLLRSLINTLVITLSPTSDASHTSCLPNPYPPDLRRYMQIGALIFLLWFFTLFEPYGLRLRHVIMGQYRPERAKARATWLYNHILRTRGGFMKFARRKLHREYKYSTEVPLTFRKWITTHIPIKMLRPLFGLCNEDKRCFLCETKEYPNDTDTELIRCKSRNCQGTYCSRCFSDIGHLCTICLSPKDYGDLSDISLEKGSSEESSDTDNSSNEDTQSGSEDRFSSGGVDYKEDDEYFFKNERKSKREWNVFTKTGRREDEIPLLPYTNYKTFQRAPPWDHNDKNDKKIMCVENTLSKLKKVLKDYSKNFIDHNGPGYYTTQKNIKLLKSILYDYENLLKDFATTTICNFKIIMEFFIQYSFYEIRKHSRSLFIIRRRRSSTIGDVIRRQYNLVVRRKIQYTSKRSKKCFQRNVLSNFNKNKSKRDHNNMDGHHFIRKRDKSVQRSSENTFHSNKQKNQRSKKNKNKEKIKKHVRPHKRSDTTKSCFRKYYTLCFGCWRQCKFNMLSCTTQADKSRPILESSKEIKNYKRRKKLNNIDLRKGTSSEKMKTDLNNTRKFRMLSYFSDQEWMRKKSGTTCNMKIESDNEMCNDLKITKSDTTAYKFEDDSSKIARKHKSSVQFHRSLRPKNYPPSEYQKYIDKINDVSNELTKKAIFRFRDAIGLKPQSAISPGQVTDKFTVEERDQREGNFMSPSPQPSTSFSRRIDFYRSLGANEFDDIYDVVNTNERTLLNTLKVIPSSGLRKKKGLSIAIKKNIARDMGFGTVPVAESPSKSHQDSVKGNKKWLHIKLRNPLHMIKEFFSPVTNGPSNEKNRKRKKKLVETGTVTQEPTIKHISRGVSASPLMKSFSCQCMPQTGTINIATQTSKDLFEGNPLEPDLVPHLSPMATEIDHKNCTCNISQHTIVQRDMGTCVDHLQQTRRDYKENVRINSTVTSDPSFSDITNVYSLKSNETHRTDTTVLSLPTIDCRKNRRPITRKPKVQVVTRANQSTATEKAIVCDVSTVTDDWWSPIIEKRKIQNSPKTKGQHKNISLEKKRGFIVQNEKIRRRLRNRGMVTDGKVVTFKSRTQIIPAEIIDILSPSRYLLESQKYYNELFLSKYYGGDMVPVLQFQKQKPLGKEMSPKISRAQSKRLGPTCHRL